MASIFQNVTAAEDRQGLSATGFSNADQESGHLADLPRIAREIEQALLDLQGPLDTLELLADTLDLREAAAIAWLVQTASSSATRLREQWERLHAAARTDRQPRP